MITSPFSRLAACALVLCAGSAAANAYEITAGQISLDYSEVSSDAENDPSQQSISGSIELEFLNGWGFQGDTHYQELDEEDVNELSFTGHGIYNVNTDLALGFFAGVTYDDIGGDADAFGFRGIEVDAVFDRTTVEAYVTDVDFGIYGYGLDAQYDFQNGVQIGASYDVLAEFFDDDIDRLAVRGSYDLTDRVTGTLEVGVVDDGTTFTDDTFFGFKVDYSFGQKHKTTFNRRNYTERLPGQ